VYNAAFRFYDLGYGSALGAAGLLLSLAVASLYFMVERRSASEKV
jgi:ABC-type sugar transport system permease subunit